VSLLRKILGRTREDWAARYLAGRGYTILGRNYHSPHGEIDLIALEGGAVVFVEVKTRTTDAYGAPELAVDQRKQERMVKTALDDLKHKKLHQMPCWFDVVAISGAGSETVELIQNAFEMDRTGR
jgi:putative endonuclease